MLSSIRARTVVLSGGADPVTPAVHARDLAAAIPGAEHVHIPGAGHMLPQEAAQLVGEAIRRAAGIDGSFEDLGVDAVSGTRPVAQVAALAGVAS